MNTVNLYVKFTRSLPPIFKMTTDIDVVMSMNQIVVSTILCAILVSETRSLCKLQMKDWCWQTKSRTHFLHPNSMAES